MQECAYAQGKVSPSLIKTDWPNEEDHCVSLHSVHPRQRSGTSPWYSLCARAGRGTYLTTWVVALLLMRASLASS